MDEFGVFTERFGLKPQGKGAPMAASKRTVGNNNNNNNNARSWNFGVESNANHNPSSFLGDQRDPKRYYGGASGDYDDIFGGNNNTTKQSATTGGGSSFDYDSFFLGSNANSLSRGYDNDDIFGAMPSNYSKNDSDDIFGSFASPPKQSAPTDDLLSDFVGAAAKPKGTTSNFDDLIPGFGANVAPNNGLSGRKHSGRQSTKSTFTSSEDPLIVLESTSTSETAYDSSDLLSDPLEGISKLNKSGGTKPPRLKSPPRATTQVSQGFKVKSSDVSSLDELEDFARGGLHNNANRGSNSRSGEEWAGTPVNRTGSYSEGDLESFFARSVSVPKSRTTTPDPVFDAPMYKKGGPRPAVPQKTSSEKSTSMKKSPSASGIYDDLSSMFEEANIFEHFEEVEDESEERRNLRHGRIQRTRQRMLKAVMDMNQRDFQSQQEQEERRRIAESLDVEIKRWAAGKEGNMRALLSSLQLVLWPECGWEPVSLTDLITSGSVKKVYMKAILCVHPDKVQQKGASLEQKFAAEKVFDILQEAWKKFGKEELS